MEQTDPKQLIIQLKAKICYLEGTKNHLECDNDYLEDKLKKIESVCQRLTNENESFKKEIKNLKKYKIYVEKYKPTMVSFLIDDDIFHDDNEIFVSQNQIESDNDSISSQSTVQWQRSVCTSTSYNTNPHPRDNTKQPRVQQGEDDSSNGTTSIDSEKFKFDAVDIHPSLEPSNIIEIDSGVDSDINSNPTNNLIMPLVEKECSRQNSNGCKSTASMETEDANFEGFDATDIISYTKIVKDLIQLEVKLNKTKPYACSYANCNKKFRNQGPLKVHMLVHKKKQPAKERERRFLCQEKHCGLRFFEKQHLERHALIHSGEKPYKCSYRQCGKRFRQSSTLKGHLRSHTKETPYVCREKGCRKKFTQLGGLRYHDVNIHNKSNATLRTTYA